MNPMTDKEEIKDGVVETFHKNGQLLHRRNYKNGNKDSPFEYFDEDGQLKFDNDFDDEIPF